MIHRKFCLDYAKRNPLSSVNITCKQLDIKQDRFLKSRNFGTNIFARFKIFLDNGIIQKTIELLVKRLNENKEGREYANMHFLQQQSLHR